jgi:hypothetical protein
MKVKELLESLKGIDVDADIKIEVIKSGNTWRVLEIDNVEKIPVVDENEVRIYAEYWGRK